MNADFCRIMSPSLMHKTHKSFSFLMNLIFANIIVKTSLTFQTYCEEKAVTMKKVVFLGFSIKGKEGSNCILHSWTLRM